MEYLKVPLEYIKGTSFHECIYKYIYFFTYNYIYVSYVFSGKSNINIINDSNHIIIDNNITSVICTMAY